MRWLLPPAAAGLWIVLSLVTAFIAIGAARVGVRTDPFVFWAVASAAMAVAIVAKRGASWTRLASLILSLISAAGSAILLSSSIAFVGAMALILSMAIAVIAVQPWPRPTAPAAE